MNSIKKHTPIAGIVCALLCYASGHAEEVGAVNTVFKWVGPDHKIVVDASDDPLVQGVVCHVGRAKTGGIKGGLGLAEDPSRFSVACQQVGAIGCRRLPAAAYGDKILASTMLTIQPDEARHLANGWATLVTLLQDDRNIPLIQAALDK